MSITSFSSRFLFKGKSLLKDLSHERSVEDLLRATVPRPVHCFIGTCREYSSVTDTCYIPTRVDATPSALPCAIPYTKLQSPALRGAYKLKISPSSKGLRTSQLRKEKKNSMNSSYVSIPILKEQSSACFRIEENLARLSDVLSR